MTSKEDYDLKKQERLDKRESVSSKAKKGNLSKKIVWWAIFIVVVVLLVLGFRKIVETNTPKGKDFSRSFQNSGREHIQIGSANLLPEGTYSSNPPSSGPHYPNIIRTGFYDEPLEDQFVIHNLEHGDIWIAYHPRVPDEIKKQLESLEKSFRIISPREANEFDISLITWGRTDSFNIEDGVLLEERIKDFTLRYDNKGPEQVRGGGGIK